jgi:hypothetical protein
MKISLPILVAALFASCGSYYDPSGADSGERGPSHEGGSSNPNSANGEQSTNEETFDLTKCEIERNGGELFSKKISLDGFSKPFEVMVLIFKQTINVSFTGTMIFESSPNHSLQTAKLEPSTTNKSQTLNDFLAKGNTAFEAELVDPTIHASIGKQFPKWRGVFCSLQAAQTILRTGKLTIKLDEPVPFMLNPSANKERVLAELSVKRSWEKITGKVVASQDASIAVNSDVSVSVSVVAAKSKESFKKHDGKAVELSGEAAFKIVWDLDAKIKSGLQLPLSTTYFVDFAKKQFSAVAVESDKDQFFVYKAEQ